MTRFLNVNVFLDPLIGGGTAERTFQISRALATEGVDTTVLTLDLDVPPARLEALAPARHILVPCMNRRFLVPKFDPEALRAAVYEADVIQLTNHWTLLNAAVHAIARRIGKPWLLCPAGALTLFGRSLWLKRAYNAVVGQRMVRDAAALIGITHDELKQFAAFGAAADRAVVIPNGVRLEDFAEHDTRAFRQRCGLRDQPLILFVGRLNAIKGPDILLHAFASLCPGAADYHLVYAGPDGGMQQQLVQQAEAIGISDRVHFAGFVSGQNKASAYHAAELVVVPSRHEAMSIVALEAGACAKPVLLTDQCGFPEVEQAGGGRIVPATIEAIAAGLKALLANEAELRRSGERLRELVRTEYTWAAAARRYREVFARVTA